MSETSTSTRQPVLYLSHGAPPLADDPAWTRELADWSGTFGKPRDILMVSAHWEEAPSTLSATAGRAAGLRLLGLPAEVLRGHL